ncbi:ABC transporter permease [Micromonospora sp. NPDC049559]|uniref:ABC transporter permease n=1 Tax=Micromonospora sp. NPDC049559 TaxID=3155923 RepID=UPI003447609E
MRRPTPGRWGRDLALGMRLVVSGGRESLLRGAMAAVGVGLGVALLLVAASISTMLHDRTARGAARDDMHLGVEAPAPGPRTMLVGQFDTSYRTAPVRGRILRPEGADAPVPPGLPRLPGPGEVYVSPALERLLASPDGALLRPRLLDARIVGTIGATGLAGPNEYAFYLGSDRLSEADAQRTDHFGEPVTGEGLDPILLLLVTVIFLVLLLPIAVFIGTAVRFGGERRDRRLAALRLVGADRSTTARIAAGEALLGALLGLAAGALFFLAGRQLVERFTLWNISFFTHDVRPSPGLALLIALAVPVASVAVALLALRRVVVEPLGVVRRAAGARRRLWWRLLLPLAGAALLLPLVGSVRKEGSSVNPTQVTAGVLLLLVGVTALLPWLVETGVRRLRGGPVSWQLATRRLQLDSAASARMVNGVAVAVAGGIALQMLFSGVSGNYVSTTGQDPNRADLFVETRLDPADGVTGDQVAERLRGTEGVREVFALVRGTLQPAGAKPDADGNRPTSELLVADCATLRELAELDRCADGDAFAVFHPVDQTPRPRPGQPVQIGDPEGTAFQSWTVPPGLRRVPPRTAPDGNIYTGFYATPGALRLAQPPGLRVVAYLRLGGDQETAVEHVRNTVAAVNPVSQVWRLQATSMGNRFANIRRGLLIGVLATLLLLGASLLVTTLEQLRERRRLLAVLVAFGTRRSTMTWSVLWQTAVPVLLGLVLAIVTGSALGAVLLRLVETPIRLNWTGIATMSGAAAGVVLGVTAFSLPVLWRLMRPDGLRTE